LECIKKKYILKQLKMWKKNPSGFGRNDNDMDIDDHISQNDKLCTKSGCQNKGKKVEYPKCPFCGTEPQAPVLISNLPIQTESKFCVNDKCTNKGKKVEYSKCPFCGNEPQLTTPRCCTQNCSNFGKIVTFPRCPFCGNEPSTEAIEKKKERKCINTVCSNYAKIVPDGFPLCPYCGTEPHLH